MIALACAVFGIVAALAGSAAIPTSSERIMGQEQRLRGVYGGAILATILAGVVLVALGRAAARVDGASA
jgi:hypothetical protein